MTVTQRLRELLDERGVEHIDLLDKTTYKPSENATCTATRRLGDTLEVSVRIYGATPEQAIEATLGRKPWVNSTWERWHKSLKHDEIKSIGDAVEQLMYETIEFGGDMGPNGNTYNGIDEGDVLTSGFINEWIRRFESTLGRDQPIVRCCDCKYFDTRKCKSQWPFRLDGFCAWGERREDE